MLDFNSRSALTDRINYLIDKKIDATAAEPSLKRLSFSKTRLMIILDGCHVD